MAIRWGEPLPLDRSAEYMPPDQLAAYQLARLRDLVLRTESNRFYSPRWRAAGVGADTLRSLDDLRRFPIIRKKDMVADNKAEPPFGTRLQVPWRDIAHVVETSGTSGLGQECYAMSNRDEREIAEMEARGFACAGARAGAVVMNTLPMATSAAGVWYYLGLKRLGCNVFEIGNYPAKRKIDFLRRFGCDLLIGTPSYLKRLEVAAQELEIEPKALGVKAFAVAGEPYSPEWVLELEATWGARLFEQYGATQRGMAWSCELGSVHDGERGMLHFLHDWCIFEVIDPATGEPVGPHAVGELVVTPLVGEATPIIRFATGDKVTSLPPGHCRCGRTSAGIAAGAVNRFDNMMKIRGLNVWPDAVDELIFRNREIAEYRGEVYTDTITGTEEVRVLIEMKEGTPCPPELLQRVCREVREVVGVRVEAVVNTGDSLLGKADDPWVKRSRWQDRRAAQGRG